MEYTVGELITQLKLFPNRLKVQLDIEGELHDELDIEAGQNKLIIFSKDEPSF